MKNKIEKRIYTKLESLSENIKYTLENLCEVMSGLDSIGFFLYLMQKENDEDSSKSNVK